MTANLTNGTENIGIEKGMLHRSDPFNFIVFLDHIEGIHD